MNKKTLTHILVLLFLILTNPVHAYMPSKKANVVTVDKNATASTKALLSKMLQLQQTHILFGHQDDQAYGREWFNEPGRSDVLETAGDYPAVVGWELGDLELGNERNLDSVSFTDMKRYIREVHERGSINTISWHTNNIATGKSAWDCEQDTVVRSVLKGGVHHKAYLKYLDYLAAFFHDLRDKNGEAIPVIFRMFHEHSGAWFWWGAKQCTPEEYIQLYKMTVEYLRDTKKVHNLLYAYSPAEIRTPADFFERFPGDEWADIVGFDTYCRDQAHEVENYKKHMKDGLELITNYAQKHNKVAVVAETGQEGIKITDYYTNILLKLIEPYKIGYVLLWRNAHEIPKHYYVPGPKHPAAADFIKFCNHPRILLSKEAAGLKMYE